MDSQVSTPHGSTARTRKTKVIGSVIAIVAMLALAGLAWHLTHQPSAAGAGGPGGPGGRGGPGGPGGPGGGRGGPSTTVGVATAKTADLPVLMDALGTVTAASSVTVRAQVGWVLQKLMFDEGQMVKAGQVIAQIDPHQYEMALLQASGARVRDEATLENARLTLKRYNTLLGQDSIARQDVDTQAALVKQLEGTVMTDRAAEGVAKLNLGYTKVVTPISGRIGLRVVDVGNLVLANDTAGLGVVTQLSPIDVEFAVPQDQVPTIVSRVNDGAKLAAVALDRTRSNELATGTFQALDNVVDTTTGTVRAKARFANAKLTLFPSQFVNVQLEMRTIKDAIMVPVTALRHSGTGDFVYVLKDDHTVTVRSVTRGQATVDQVQVLTGLKAGERVITEGADRLKEGAKVTLSGDKPAAAGAGATGRRHRKPADAASASAAAPAPAAAAPAAASPASAAPAAAPAQGAAK